MTTTPDPRGQCAAAPGPPTTKAPPPDTPAEPRVRDLDELLRRLDARLQKTGAPTLEGWVEDARGRLVRETMVPDSARLEDQTVRTIAAYGLDLAEQIARFRSHSYSDLLTHDDLVTERYGAKRRGGRKGNRIYHSYDGRVRIVIQVQDRMSFGPELGAARDLVEECVEDWAADSREEVRALIQHAFSPGTDGAVSREAVLAIRRLVIDDPRWRRAQAAITDSIRVTATKSYLRLYLRPSREGKWTPVPIDISAEWPPG